MLSAAVAGILRIGAVFLVAGGLAGGVYLLVQVGEEDDASHLQTDATATLGAPAPLSPPAGLSPPADVTRRPTPTPTYPPAPTPAGPAVDTSDWKIYTSPLGFTIKYPPGWEVVPGDAPGLPVGNAKIENEARQEGRAEQVAAGVQEGAKSGEAWIEIVPDPYPEFDVEALFEICRPSNLPPSEVAVSEPSRVTFQGLPAVRCVGEGPGPGGDYHTISGEGYYVGIPAGRLIHIATYAVDGDQETLQLLQTILATVSLEGGQ